MQKANRRPVYSRHVLNQVQVQDLLKISAEREFPRLKIQFDANVKWLLLGVLRAMFGCDATLLQRGMAPKGEGLKFQVRWFDEKDRFYNRQLQTCLEAMLINTTLNHQNQLTNGRRPLTLKQSMKMALRVWGHITQAPGLDMEEMEKYAEKVRDHHELLGDLTMINSATRTEVEVYLRRGTGKLELDKATARGSWFLAGAVDYYGDFVYEDYIAERVRNTPKRIEEIVTTRNNPYEQDLYKNWAETYRIKEYDVQFALDVILKCAVDANLLRNRPNRAAIILKEIDFEIAIHYLALFTGEVLIEGFQNGQKLAMEHFSRRS